MTDETADSAERSAGACGEQVASLSDRLRQVAHNHPAQQDTGALTVADVALTVADYVDAVSKEEALEDLHRLLAFRPGMTAALAALLLAVVDDGADSTSADSTSTAVPEPDQAGLAPAAVTAGDVGAPTPQADDFQVVASTPAEAVVWSAASPDWTESAFDDNEDIAYEQQLRDDQERQGLEGNPLSDSPAHPSAPGRHTAPPTDQHGAVPGHHASQTSTVPPTEHDHQISVRSTTETTPSLRPAALAETPEPPHHNGVAFGHRPPQDQAFAFGDEQTSNTSTAVSETTTADPQQAAQATPESAPHHRWQTSTSPGPTEQWGHSTVVGTPGAGPSENRQEPALGDTGTDAGSSEIDSNDSELPDLGVVPPAPTWARTPGGRTRPAPRRPMRAPIRPRKMPFSTLVPAPSPDPFGEAPPVRGSTETNFTVPAPATDPFARARHDQDDLGTPEPPTPAWGEPVLPHSPTPAPVTPAGLSSNARTQPGDNNDEAWADLDLDSLGDIVATTGAGAVESSAALHSNATPPPPDWLVRASSVGASPMWADDSSPASELYDLTPEVVTEMAPVAQTNPAALPKGVTVTGTEPHFPPGTHLRRASGGTGLADAGSGNFEPDVAPDTGEVPVVPPAGHSPDIHLSNSGPHQGNSYADGLSASGSSGGHGTLRLPEDVALYSSARPHRP